jgi:hypothetical protein
MHARVIIAALLVSVGAVLLAAPVAAGAASPSFETTDRKGKRKASKRCPKAAIRVTIDGRKGCVRLRDLGPRKPSPQAARQQAIAAFTSPSAFRHLAGPKLAKHAGKLSRAARSLLKPAAARLPGPRPLALTTTPHQPPAGSVGSGGTVENDSKTGNGGSGSARMTQRAFVKECPQPGGKLPGDGEAAIEVKMTAPLPEGVGRRRLEVSSKGSLDAELEGHVGDDARLRDYDLDVRIKVKRHLRVLGPAGLEHLGTRPAETIAVSLSLTGLKPGRPVGKENFSQVRITDPGSPEVVAGQEYLSFRTSSVESAMALLSWFKGSADDAMERAERIYHDDAGCLKATFDPATLSMRANEPRPVGVTVADREGRPVALNLVAQASGAQVAPPAVATNAAGAASFTLTPQAGAASASLTVAGTSNRGRVRGAVSGPVENRKIFLYAVELNGSGSYTSDFGTTASFEHHADVTMESFVTRWAGVALPADGGPILQSKYLGSSHDMTGLAHSTGEDVRPVGGGGSYDCEGPLGDSGGANHHLDVAPAGGGSLTLALEGFHGLFVEPGTWTSCTGTGTYENPSPGATGPGGNDFDGRTSAFVTLTPAQLDRETFTVPLTGQPLPPGCLSNNSPPFYCTHTLSWTATATFTRYGSCTRAGDRYACTLTRMPPFFS